MRRIGSPVFRKSARAAHRLKYDKETDRRILALLDTPPPAGYANWSGHQVEIWFSILAAKSLDGASFQRVPELAAHIQAFIEDYNETASRD
jgi:hypothetical protein